MNKITIFALVLCFGPTCVRADDPSSKAGFSKAVDSWPQWRGPESNGVAPHADPPIKWDGKTNIKWKLPIAGQGKATPIVWGNRVFVLTAIKTDRKPEKKTTSDAAFPQQDERRRGRRGRGGRRRFGGRNPENVYQFNVVCVDRQAGKILWEKTANEMLPHEGTHSTGSFASASPVTDGRQLYVSFGSRGVYCYDFEGNQKWKRDLGKMNIVARFGEGVSPSLHGDTLMVNWDHQGDSFIVALDTRTGDTKWKRERDEGTSWATPLIVEYKSGVQVITNASGRVRSYDFTSGKTLWECGGQTRNVIPTPVTNGTHVFCMSGFRGNALYAIPLDASGDITGSEKISWHQGGPTPYVPSPLLYGGLLYFIKSNNAFLSCLKAEDGKALFENQRLPGLGRVYASPVGAAGRIYVVDLDGNCVVLKQGPKLEVIATNELGEPVDSSPALVGKQIFLRGRRHLYCIEKA